MKIVPYTKSLKNSTIECLCRSFQEDPLTNAILDNEYDKYSPFLFRIQIWITQSYKLSECMIDTNEKVVCAAVWEPAKPSLLVMCKFFISFIAILWNYGWRMTKRFMIMFDELEKMKQKHAPKALHLQILGTDPLAQGKGLGSRLIQYGIQRADDLGVSCYLESSNPKNVPFYERHGFQTLELYYPLEKDKTCEGKGPVCTIMLREYSP